MQLYHHSVVTGRWTASVLKRFFRVCPRTTSTVIGYSVLSRVARTLAFLLPLKVILLAGSPGVPRYFSFFISPENKDVGVVVLAAAAVVMYGLTLVIEARSKTLSDRGSGELLAASGVMALVSDQRVLTQSYYGRFTQIAAGALFALVGLVVMALLDAVLFVWIFCLALALFLFTAFSLRQVTPISRTRISDLITLRLGNYLGILSSIAFLSSFLVILSPFLAPGGGNVLIAIVCIILVRQFLSTMTSEIKNAVSLAEHRQLIDTLVFPNRRFQRDETKHQRAIRDLFGRVDRERVAKEQLSHVCHHDQTIQIEWRDPSVRGVSEFGIAIEGRAPVVHLRQRNFPPRLHHLLENEDLLFKYVERQSVWAPPLVRRFTHADHECIVVDDGTGVPPSAGEWKKQQKEFIATLLALQLPEELIKRYQSSHTLLHERLSPKLLSRLEIAIDTPEEERVYASLVEASPRIRNALSCLPLRLVHNELRNPDVGVGADGSLFVANWSKWSIEPFGTGLTRRLSSEAKLGALIDRVREINPAALRPTISPARIRSVALCALLERSIQRGSPKAGIGLAKLVINTHRLAESKLETN